MPIAPSRRRLAIELLEDRAVPANFSVLGEGVPYAISADGSTVVGILQTPYSYQMFRWTEDNGLIDLGPSFQVIEPTNAAPGLQA